MIALKCKDHPRYNGGKSPRASCEACRWLYELVWGLVKPAGVVFAGKKRNLSDGGQ